MIAPDFVWDMGTFEGWPDKPEFHGADGLREFVSIWREPYDDWSMVLDEVHDCGGNRVLALLHQSGKPHGSDSDGASPVRPPAHRGGRPHPPHRGVRDPRGSATGSRAECLGPSHAVASWRRPPAPRSPPRSSRPPSRRRPTAPTWSSSSSTRCAPTPSTTTGSAPPTWTRSGGEGISFVNVHPEAMPTVPARNSILGGRRMFPFRGWHDRRGLIASPGWSPLTHVDAALTSAFRRGGYFTAYVTDNPFLGFSQPYEPVRRSVHRFVRTGGQIGGNKPVSSVPKQVLNHWLHHSIAAARARAGRPLPRQLPRLGERRQLVRRPRLQERHRRARHAAARAAALLHGRGHLRAARALDAAEALPRHVRRPALARREPSMPLYMRTSGWLAPQRAADPSSAA